MSELKFTADIDIKVLEQKLKKVDEDFTKVARDAAQAGSVIDKIFKQAATDSINGMILKLGELQKAYNDLSAADRATQGAGLITQINTLSASVEAAKNQFGLLETSAAGSIDSMVAKMSELQRQFSALSATDRGTIGVGLQKEIQLLSKSIEDAKGEFVSMENVAEDSINGMINKLIELQRQYNNLSASDRVKVGSGLQDQIKVLGTDIENAKKQFISLANVSEDSVQGMTVKLQELNAQFRLLSASDREGAVGIKMAQDMAILAGEIDQVNMKMRAMAGQSKSSTSSLYGLNYSIQQIGRELPNIAYGFPLFIMAISNNLPILTDSISQARKENELLKQSGQSSTPVWKQVASSIFSWQTAMILGVTAMTVFGAKIPGLISDLFRMKDGLKLTSEEMKGLNESFSKSAGSELGKLKSLFDALENAKEGTVEYTDAKAVIIDQYSKNLEGMDAEIRSLEDQKGAYEALTKAIYETAKAESLKKLNSDLGEKLITETTPLKKDIYEKLTERFGKEKATQYTNAIVTALQTGKEIDADIQKVIDSFKKEFKTDYGTIDPTIAITRDALDPNKKNPGENLLQNSIDKAREKQKDFNTAMKEGQEYADAVFGNNTQKKVKDLIKEQEDLLKIAKLKPQGTTAELEAKNKEIKAIEDQIKAYKELGVEKEKGAGKLAEEELSKAKEKLNNAIIANDQKEIIFQAAKIALLERELELRKWIAYEAIGFAKGDITQADRNAVNNPTAITSKGLSPILQKGGLGTNAKGQVIEITAIDKTGPTFKKVGLETEKLNKNSKKLNEQAAKDQEKLDKEAFDKKQRNQEDLLNYSRQFTSELIDQLGLTEDQSKVLNGMADTVFNLAKGDYLAAAFSGASTLMTALFSGKEKEDPTIKALETMNKLLDQQESILNNLKGSDYFALAEKQYKDLGTTIDLNNEKLQTSHMLTKQEYADAQARYNQHKKDFPYDPITQMGWQKYREQLSGETANWTPDQFVKAYAEGSLVMDQQEIDWVQGIVNAQKQRSVLLQETFREALGFDSSEVSDSIFSGIEEGLRLGEDSLGGFAKSFGDLMGKALMQAITDASNLSITNKFLPKVQEFLQNADVGPNGEKLTEGELLILEELYASEVRSGQEMTDALKPITDKYGTKASSTALTGITASLTEETGSLLVGLITGMRIDTNQTGVDIKSMLNFSQNQLEIMDQQLSVLNKVEMNTRPLSRLEAIENGIKDINLNLKNMA